MNKEDCANVILLMGKTCFLYWAMIGYYQIKRLSSVRNDRYYVQQKWKTLRRKQQ